MFVNRTSHYRPCIQFSLRLTCCSANRIKNSYALTVKHDNTTIYNGRPILFFTIVNLIKMHLVSMLAFSLFLSALCIVLVAGENASYIKIGAFNIQIFGVKKAANPDIMQYIIKVRIVFFKKKEKKKVMVCLFATNCLTFFVK